MPIQPNDYEYIKKALLTNNAVLLLGAGFSRSCKNRLGEHLPSGMEFAEKLWKEIGYSGDYDKTTPLTDLYDSALGAIKHTHLKNLILNTFHATVIPDWYSIVTKIIWHRVYTFNIDNVVESVYTKTRPSPKLDTINGLSAEYRDRNQFLDSIQYVKLNGDLQDDPKDITFSFRQYARRLVDSEIWYDNFIRDYTDRPTIIIGSTLNEPILWRALEARERRVVTPDSRPRSFIITPSITEPQRDKLKQFNIFPILMKAEEFFVYMNDRVGAWPTGMDILMNSNADLRVFVDQQKGHLSTAQVRDITSFYRCFRPVSGSSKKPGQFYTRRMFYQGTEPTWADIENDLDAERDVNNTLLDSIQRASAIGNSKVISVTGYAGSGKTTVAMRVATRIARLGRKVFFTDSEDLPSPLEFEAGLKLLPPGCVLFLDNASNSIAVARHYIDVAQRHSADTTFVLIERANRISPHIDQLRASFPLEDISVPTLSDSDIWNLIDTLQRNNYLGELAGKNRDERFKAFSTRAQKQILVAMKEATEGDGFDRIIEGEFAEISPEDARFVYLCVCLATSFQFSVTPAQMYACSDSGPAAASAYLASCLRDILVPSQTSDGRLSARHRVIADHILDNSAPIEMLQRAYIRIISVVAHNIPFGSNLHSLSRRLYRRLINHETIFRRFRNELTIAREIFESISSRLKPDHLFWLQYGLLELHYGELSIAMNYINQAYSLRSDDYQVVTARAHLFYKLAHSAENRVASDERRASAIGMLELLMAQRPEDIYPPHVYITQEFGWIKRWAKDRREKIILIDALLTRCTAIEHTHKFSLDIKRAITDIRSAKLDLAIL